VDRSSGTNIAEALSGRGGVAGVQWALLDSTPRDLVAEAVADLLEPGAEATGWRLHRAKFKPDRVLIAHFEVTIRSRNRDQMRPVVVTWTPDGDRWGPGFEPAVRELEARAAEWRLAAPFRGLYSRVPEWGMQILVSPVDPRFPQLIFLSEPERVRSMLASVYGISVDEAPAYDISTIRYRPDERHVLRYAPAGSDGDSEATVFAKMSRGHDVGTEYRVASSAAEWIDGLRIGVHVARPLACIAEHEVVLYPRVGGETLSHLFMRAQAGVEEHVRRTGAVLRALHDSPPAPDLELEQHDFHKELKAIARAAEHVDRLLPEVGALLEDALSRAEPVYSGLPSEPSTFVHGDFKADHLLIEGTDLTVLDFGTCRFGDPALDLGKLAADLHWWYSLSGAPGLDEARRAFFEGYGSAPEGRLLRAGVYEALVLMKSTVRRVPLYEEVWADRTAMLIRRADEILRATEASGVSAP
jgi:aminoglycoside phosphotransferase (APT) family kinase protein